MNGIAEAAIELQKFLEEGGRRFCIIGGLAVIRWGEYRGTQDVDLSVLVEFGGEREFAETVVSRFPARMDAAAEFAEQARVVLITATNGVPVDIALAGFPFEAEMIARATPWYAQNDIVLTTVSAEDLVVLKAFAGRDRDWGDVRGILLRQQNSLDGDAALSRLAELCKFTESHEPVNRLQSCIDELSR